jgi:trehalose-phosphatase
MVERKARGVAFHYRRADMKEAERLLPRVVDAAGHASDVHLRRGKCVLEFTLDTVTKGEAIVELRQIHMPTCTLYLGDDQTDEDAFAALTETDIGVKVGTGPTVAPYRLADVAQVTTFLSCLLAIRSNQAGASR